MTLSSIFALIAGASGGAGIYCLTGNVLGAAWCGDALLMTILAIVTGIRYKD